MVEITKFYTPTCVPCKIVGRMLDVLCERLNIELIEIDATIDIESVKNNNITTVPTIIINKNDELIKLEGMIKQDDIIKHLEFNNDGTLINN